MAATTKGREIPVPWFRLQREVGEIKNLELRLLDSATGADTGTETPGGDALFDFAGIAAAARRQRRLLAVWTGSVALLGLVYLATTPPSYRAVASVLLTGEASQQADEVGVTSALTDTAVETAQQLFRSHALALRVTDSLGLSDDPAYLDRPVSLAERLLGTVTGVAGGAIDLLSPAPPSGRYRPSTAEEIAEARRQSVARSLEQHIELGRVGRSTALWIGLELHDPALAARIVNAYTEAYTSDQVSTSFEATTRTTDWLKQRLSELQADARQAAMEAERFRAENGLVASGGTLTTEDNVGRFNAELSTAQAEAARSRALVDSYEAALAFGPQALSTGGSQRLSLPGDARLAALEQTLSSLVAKRDEVLRNYGPRDPQSNVLGNQIRGAAQRLYSEMERQAKAARGESEVAEARVASLSAALSPMVDANSQAQRAQIEYRLLEQRALSLGQLYETFLIQFQEANQLRLYPGSLMRVLTPAEVPRDASAPSAKRVLALCLILGLMAGTAHATLREGRDRSLRTARDVTQGLGVRFLGYLPKLVPGARDAWRSGPPPVAQEAKSDAAWAVGKRGLASAAHPLDYPLAHLALPRSRYSETLRGIRNAVAATPLRVGEGGIILGVTSILPGAGKTSFAADLAGVLSQPGERVLLIDGNPRDRGLSRMLGLEAGSDLMQAITGRADWHDCRATLAGAGVDVLGWSDPEASVSPGDLLSASGLREVIAQAAQEYPAVIVDLGPLGPLADAYALLPVLDRIVVVARWGETPAAAIRQVLRQDPELGKRLLGLVFSAVEMDRLRDFAGPDESESLEPAYGRYFA